MQSGQNRQQGAPAMRLALAGVLVSGMILVLAGVDLLQPDQPGTVRMNLSAPAGMNSPAAKTAACVPCHFR